MRMTTRLVFCSLGALAVAWALVPGDATAALIDDDFETDSSADYTVVSLGDAADGSTTFAFDYIAAGIPLAPRSTAGDKGGLKFTANDSLGADNVFTAFHNTALPANVKLTVDMYMGVTGFSGTTEYGHIGVGGDGTTVNSIFSPIEGSGDFIAIDGDGDVTSDYRWSRPDGSGGRDTVPGSGDSLSPSYWAGGSNNDLQLYQDLFPTGTPAAGSPGNLWTTVEVVTFNGTTSVALDGTTIIAGSAVRNGGILAAGLASLGYGDVFTSVAQPLQAQFGIFDNLTVEESFSVVPEPSSLLLIGLGTIGLCTRRRRRSQ